MGYKLGSFNMYKFQAYRSDDKIKKDLDKIANIINIQKIVTLHYFEFERSFRSKGESHDFWEMIYADKGDLQVKLKNKEFTLSQGECYFHKPNEFHTHYANGVVAPNIFIISA